MKNNNSISITKSQLIDAIKALRKIAEYSLTESVNMTINELSEELDSLIEADISNVVWERNKGLSSSQPYYWSSNDYNPDHEDVISDRDYISIVELNVGRHEHTYRLMDSHDTLTAPELVMDYIHSGIEHYWLDAEGNKCSMEDEALALMYTAFDALKYK